MKYTTPSGTTDVGILTPKQQIKISTHYTVLLQLKKSNLPTETSYIYFGSGFGGYLMFESSTTPLIFRHNTNETETLISLVKTKSVIDNDKYGSLKIPIYFTDIPKDFETEIDIIILEGDHTDKPLEFFEGLKSAEVAEIGTHGVNLLDHSTFFKHDDSWEAHKYQNAYNGKALHLKPNTSYVFEWDGLFARTSPRQQFALNFYLNASSIGVFNRWNDTTDTSKVIKLFTTGDDGEIGFSAYGLDYDWIESFKTPFHIYEVTTNTPTEYVPYQSSKVTLPSPIKLRSLPNGVADSYDVDTGVLTRRCGEVVLDGSESWGLYTISNPNNDFLSLRLMGKGVVNTSNRIVVLSDKFKALTGDSLYLNGGQDAISQSGDGFHVIIAKSKLTTPDVAGFKAWLTQNPTTVVYQLATPTTEYIENNGQLRSYDSQTTVFANSIVPVKISGNIPISYASALSSALSQVSLLKAENQLLRSQMETQVAEVRDELNQVHAAMYRMMNFNQSEEGDHATE